MHRSLRLDVVDDDALIVFVFDSGGDFAVDDLLKQGLGHGDQRNRSCSLAFRAVRAAARSWMNASASSYSRLRRGVPGDSVGSRPGAGW